MVAIIGRRVPVGGIKLPQQGGVGDVFSAFAAPFMNGLDNDLKRSKLDEADREAAGVAGVQAAIEAARGGQNIDVYGLASSGVGTKRSMGDLAKIMPMIYGNTRGAGHQSTTDALVASGENYGSTVHGTREGEANKRAIQQMVTDRQVAHDRWKTDNTPEMVMGPDGQPTIMRRSESFGQRPVMNLAQVQGAFAVRNIDRIPELKPAEQNFISAQPTAPTAHSYATPDGRQGTTHDGGKTDAHSGEPLAPGTQVIKLEGASSEGLGGAKLTNDTTNRRIVTEQTRSAIARLDTELQKPNAAAATGWLGSGAGLFNNVRSQVEATVKLLNPQATTLEEEMRDPNLQAVVKQVFGSQQFNNMAQQLGIQHSVLQSQITNLAYLMAKAQDPSGRISTPDFENAMRTIGAAAMDPTAMRAVLRELDAQVVGNQQIWEREVNRTRSREPYNPQAPMQQPTGAAPVVKWGRRPDGSLGPVQ